MTNHRPRRPAHRPSPTASGPGTGGATAGDTSGADGDPAGRGVGTGAGEVTDEVDRLVAAWQKERPDLDVEPLHVFSRVSRLARHLDRARRAAFAEHDLEPWEFDVLTALRRAGPPYEL